VRHVNSSKAPARRAAGAGFTLIELLLFIAIAATFLGMTVPLVTSALDEMRTAMAARYLAGRILAARLDALQRSACVGFRFEPAGSDYSFATYADGNQNGLRTAEITSGTDPIVTTGERLADRFSSVRFGLMPAVPDLDGARQMADTDGVRIGSPKILTLSPDGTASSGTVYVRGTRAQYAVRVLGATGRTRVFHYQRGAQQWVSR
jgi:type II secretory pathway pseudopilin PulG